ncbi:MAG: molecular chaperone DnaJ [Candidatus Heimdallarchaeota archaeon]|nr:molecular chaperone DnaJ [Candidatus Heimdallarchaeota archaeon]
MSKKRDYYEVLGLSKSATEKELKKSYRKRAMEYHPDKYQGAKDEAEEKFKELNEAYSILSDSQKREVYDRFGHAGLEGAGSSARGADPFEFFSSIFGGSSMFDNIFGGMGNRRSRQRGPRRGDDVVLDLELSFEDAFSGIGKKIRMPFRKACANCTGTGAEGGALKTCATCQGSGVVENRVQQGFFIQIIQEPCRECYGRGQIPKNKCKICKGSGRSKEREEITVRIPKGIDDGQAIRVQGKGKPSSNGGLAGDLIFRIHLKEHELFQRNGLDTYAKIEVDYPTLVLGGKINVPTISGKGEKSKTELSIKSGSQLNDVIKSDKNGFESKVRGNEVKGDAYYVLSLKVPKRVNKRTKELLKELQDSK